MTGANRLAGIALAATAATLFAMAPMTVSAAGSAQGHCTGVNACKGHSDCKTADNSCKGQNACKGQGFVMSDQESCKQLGGKFQKG